MFENAKKDLKEIIYPSEKLVFLVGAGVSMEKPSSLPSAVQLVKNLVKLSVPSEEIDGLLRLKTLRYEGLIEHIQEHIDPNLDFLDFLEIRQHPNIIHYFLAHSILKKQTVITTNFDFFIERALLKVIPPETNIKINPIITKDQYIELNKNSEVENKQYIQNESRFYKIHGSKKNIITNQNTSESLITTLSSLGKDREEGETLSIEAYKKGPIVRLMDGATLVVLGYSGSDDFDISPLLQELDCYKKIIWIDHNDDFEGKIYRISSNTTESDKFSKQERFLYNLAMRSDNDIEVYLIKTHTSNFVSGDLWNILLNSISQPIISIDTDLKSDSQTFESWVGMLEKYKNIPNVTKYLFTGCLYYSLSLWNESQNVWEKGLKLARTDENKKFTAEFLANISNVYSANLDYQRAVDLLNEANILFKELEDIDGQSSCLNNLGIIYKQRTDYAEAINHYEKALKNFQDHQKMEDAVPTLINIGVVYSVMNMPDKTIPYFNQALEIVNKTGNIQHKAEILMNLGINQRLKGEFMEALQSFESAIQIDKLLGDDPQRSVRLHHIGLTYSDMGDTEKSIIFLNKGLTIARETKYTESVESILQSLGQIYEKSGQLDLSLKIRNESLELCRKHYDHPRISSLLLEIGNLYFNQREFETGAKYFEQSLEVAKSIGNLSFVAQNLGSQAGAYFQLGLYDSALLLYEQVLKLIENDEDSPNKAYYFRSVGICHYRLSESIESTDSTDSNESINSLEKACHYLRLAKEIYGKLGQNDIADQIELDIQSITQMK